MSDDAWTDIIVEHIIRQIDERSGCILIVDDDRLLTGNMHERLSAYGWPVVVVGSDPLELRIAYEKTCRVGYPAQPDNTLLLVSADAPLPYDIETSSTVLTVGLADIFPRLDTAQIAGLPQPWYGHLYAAHADLDQSVHLDSKSTTRFLLRHCVGEGLPVHVESTDYVKLLVSLVCQHQRLTEHIQSALTDIFLPVIGRGNRFPNLVEAERFLSDVWSAYWHSLSKQTAIAELGDPLLSDVVNQLHQEPTLQTAFTRLRKQGHLPAWQPLPDDRIADWLQQDVHYVVDRTNFLLHEMKLVREQVPTPSGSLADWREFAFLWARMRLAFYRTHSVDQIIVAEFRSLHEHLESTFLAWLLDHYASLLQRPYLPDPAMVHQLLPYLATIIDRSERSSLAILVVDGMALDDWVAIEDIWNYRQLAWHIDTHTLLAIVPTLTSVSRQSLLAGKAPHHFADSWVHTNREHVQWEAFWNEQGIQKEQMLYIRNLTDQAHAAGGSLDQMLANSQAVVGAFVINTLDSMIHRTNEAAQLLARIQTWESRFSVVRGTVAVLLEHFDRVVVTSDHGHLEGVGIGDIPMGQVAEERASRARVFTTQQPESLVSHQDVLRWPGWGLPSDSSTLIPINLGLFIDPGRQGIGHGGASLEEVFVPFAIITRK